ncbi:MAG TPA: 50S ribosomal protein L5 [Bacteroidota bacterium]|nr:50S ribosomal protein L5 [Bacteroidota bacterium]
MAKEKSSKKEMNAEAAPKTKHVEEKGVPPRLFELYKKEVVPALMKRFQYKSVMQVPRLEKIAINIGVGQATQDPKLLEVAMKELEMITGQKVAVTKSKKAISNFKLREGLAIGCRVTLRRARMYEFLDRFINVALPRVRDFRGVSDRSFDGHGNYTVGIKEQIIFPEIDVDKVTRITGMDITFVTTAKTDLEAMELLRGLGMPFVKRQEVLTPAA